MSYTHYWRRSPILDRDAFVQATEDIRLVLDAVAAKGVKLAGPTGIGQPEISDGTIAFNGDKHCGHRYRDLGKPWPSKTAEGVEETNQPIAGPWFSGALLNTRVCGGSCAGQAFVIDRSFIVRPWDQLEKEMYFCYCETGYKPYDLAVTASLIRLKERLGDEIIISSDGLERGFEDAKRICRELFGWHTRFELEKEGVELA